MKKAKAKKPAVKKEEKAEPVADPTQKDEKAESTPKPAAEDTNGAASKGEQDGIAKDAEEKVPELNKASSHHRAPSVSQQSKMRSSSFRQSSGGLNSPGYFPADGDTAPEIYRKQAVKIEELEKENKRLTKDASDGEKRWKKAEEELEDLREAEGDSPSKLTAGGSSGEIEKLVRNMIFIYLVLALIILSREQKLQPFSGKIRNYSRNQYDGMVHRHLYQQRRPQTWKLFYFRKIRLLNLWRLRYRIYALNWIG